MPKWSLKFKEAAEDDLVSLDSQLCRKVIDKLDWLINNFDDIIPLPLGGKWKGLFKLRVGDWRVIYGADFSKKLIFVYYIDRRDKIYKIKRQREKI